MEQKITNIEKLTNEKYLNLYKIYYDVKNGDKTSSIAYLVASRRDTKNITANTKEYISHDAVMIVPYYFNTYTKEYELVLCHEYRYSINRFLYSFPAGLVDSGESDIDTAKRESKEECGIELESLECLVPQTFVNEGLSDETNAVFIGKVKKFTTQDLQDVENISVIRLPLSRCDEFLKEHMSDISNRAYILIKYMQIYLSNK